MRLFIDIDRVKPRGFHKTSQTGISHDMRLFIHFNSVKPRGFHKTSQTGIIVESESFTTVSHMYVIIHRLNHRQPRNAVFAFFYRCDVCIIITIIIGIIDCSTSCCEI